jgi:hypothetical protein
VTGAVVDAKQELEHEEWMRRQEHLLLPG